MESFSAGARKKCKAPEWDAHTKETGRAEHGQTIRLHDAHGLCASDTPFMAGRLMFGRGELEVAWGDNVFTNFLLLRS